MYAELPPQKPGDNWQGWRAKLIAFEPDLAPVFRLCTRIAHVLFLAGRYSAEIARELRQDPAHGFSFWLAHQRNEHERLTRLAQLRQRLTEPDFRLQEVSQTFEGLVLKKDDAGQALWFAEAGDKLDKAAAAMETSGGLALFEEALKELRFLTEMDGFYQRYALTPLGSQVKTMYDALLTRLDNLAQLKKSEQQQAQAQAAIDVVRAEEARLLAEQAKLAEENARIRALTDKLEAEKITNAERKRLAEAEAERLRAEEETARLRAERERQANLEREYARMQDEERLRMALSQAPTLNSQLEALTLALALGRFDASDPVVSARLSALTGQLRKYLPG